MLFSTLIVVQVLCDPIDNTKECLINYLRSQNLDDEVFNSIAIEEITEPCKRRIKSEKDLVFITAHRTYERKAEFSRNFDCFIDSIKNDDHFKNLFLMKKGIESIKLGWTAKLNPKNWLPGKKYNAKKTVESEIKAIEDENLFVCEYKTKFESLYIKSEPQRSDVEVQRCAQNESVKIKTNNGRKSRQTETNLNCIELLNGLKADTLVKLQGFYSHLKPKVQTCVSESLRSKDFLAPLLAKGTHQTLDGDGLMNRFVELSMNTFRDTLKSCQN